jgi:RecA-family ATPase
LGDILCIEGDVLYCALEDNPRRLKRRVKKLVSSDRWPERLKFECRIPRLSDGGVDFIRRWIEGVPEPRLVVIDTLAKVRDSKGAQESSYEADYRSVSELKALADEKGIAIVLVHHQRKMTAEDPLDTVSGTTGLTGAVDSVLVLVRDGNGTTLHGTGRDLEQIEDAVEFDREACLWRILGKAAEVRRTDERRTILKVLGEATSPLGAREITDLAGMSYEAGRKRLHRMVIDKEIERVGRGLFSPLQNPVSQASQRPNAERDDDD